MDLGDWAPRDNVPATRALMQQKEMTMSDVERWWYEKLGDGMLPGVHMSGDWKAEPVSVIKEQLRADYLLYAKEQRAYRPADSMEFGRRLSRLVNYKNTQLKVPDTLFGLKVDAKSRASAYVLPALGDCRLQFEERMGGKVEWPRE
jgi:hypothetical protein